jgi:hypothetical protein
MSRINADANHANDSKNNEDDAVYPLGDVFILPHEATVDVLGEAILILLRGTTSERAFRSLPSPFESYSQFITVEKDNIGDG